MNIFTLKNTRIIALILSLVSIKLFLDQNKKNYKGKYHKNGSYDTISSTKHDMLKSLFIDMFPLLIFGISNNEVFYNSVNPLNSILGKSLVVSFSYFVYYKLFEPYFVAILVNW